MWRYFTLNRYKKNYREQFQMLCVNLASVLDGLVGLFSLGYVGCDLTSWLLFEVFMED
jgi:hypothetical protein